MWKLSKIEKFCTNWKHQILKFNFIHSDIELGDRFEVLTNSQCEKGRPDITFIPKELVKDHRGYVFEFNFNNIRLIF